MITILKDTSVLQAPSARVINGDLWVDHNEALQITGTPAPATEAVNVSAIWRDHERALASDDSGQVWVLGASAGERANALRSLQAPDFSLPDLDGNMHSLADYRGKKVFLATWASW